MIYLAITITAIAAYGWMSLLRTRWRDIRKILDSTDTWSG